MKNKKGTTLIEDTERLVHQIVRDATRRRIIDNKYVPQDFLDRCRAADAALKFLAMQRKHFPEEEISEFERGLHAYHDQGEGDADSGATSSNGAAAGDRG
jgi:hypothetical protein